MMMMMMVSTKAELMMERILSLQSHWISRIQLRKWQRILNSFDWKLAAFLQKIFAKKHALSWSGGSWRPKSPVFCVTSHHFYDASSDVVCHGTLWSQWNMTTVGYVQPKNIGVASCSNIKKINGSAHLSSLQLRVCFWLRTTKTVGVLF